MTRALLPLASALLASVARAQVCVPAPPASPFALPDYTGTWYEIGKIQTFGGAIFESSCVCTQLIVAPAPGGAPGDASVVNSCRDKTPAGEFINATAQLVNMQPPGHWDESFLPPVFKVFVNSTVIFAGTEGDDEYSVEYDCSGEGIFNNYCIHILARKPTMAPALVSKLVNASLALKLNTQNLPFNFTRQDGCWA